MADGILERLEAQVQLIKKDVRALSKKVDALTGVKPKPPKPKPPKPPPPSGQWPSPLRWLHTDVSTWRETSRITRVAFSKTDIVIEHSKAGKWPTINIGDSSKSVVIEANPWVIAKDGDRWYAATFEWLRPGQSKKGISATNIGAHIKQAPLDRWRPRTGETVYFLVSTPARDNRRTTEERSNVVKVEWGRDWRA